MNASANDIEVPPFLRRGGLTIRTTSSRASVLRISSTIATVMRGGTGLYYYEPITSDTLWTVGNSRKVAVIQIANDGRAELRGRSVQRPAAADAAKRRSRFCHSSARPRCSRAGARATSRARRRVSRTPSRNSSAAEYSVDLGYSWQNSIGIAHQIGNTMAIKADYVYNQGRNEKDIIDNVNLTYNPATGANYPFSDVSRRAFPALGKHLAARP